MVKLSLIFKVVQKLITSSKVSRQTVAIKITVVCKDVPSWLCSEVLPTTNCGKYTVVDTKSSLDSTKHERQTFGEKVNCVL